ncbi:hypothetical protein MOBT1_001405 [Malassezia obtusa]|uniref:Uncharacterized protein n=1 Tax=Malassezia obtusa TaxID=76774 RepID=A0AAF0IW70_9BASI|nr:hypothetical protein MOBT1_001405 [Malassezia obtusa]
MALFSELKRGKNKKAGQAASSKAENAAKNAKNEAKGKASGASKINDAGAADAARQDATALKGKAPDTSMLQPPNAPALKNNSTSALVGKDGAPVDSKTPGAEVAESAAPGHSRSHSLDLRRRLRMPSASSLGGKQNNSSKPSGGGFSPFRRKSSKNMTDNASSSTVDLLNTPNSKMGGSASQNTTPGSTKARAPANESIPPVPTIPAFMREKDSSTTAEKEKNSMLMPSPEGLDSDKSQASTAKAPGHPGALVQPAPMPLSSSAAKPPAAASQPANVSESTPQQPASGPQTTPAPKNGVPVGRAAPVSPPVPILVNPESGKPEAPVSRMEPSSPAPVSTTAAPAAASGAAPSIAGALLYGSGQPRTPAAETQSRTVSSPTTASTATPSKSAAAAPAPFAASSDILSYLKSTSPSKATATGAAPPSSVSPERSTILPSYLQAQRREEIEASRSADKTTVERPGSEATTPVKPVTPAKQTTPVQQETPAKQVAPVQQATPVTSTTPIKATSPAPPTSRYASALAEEDDGEEVAEDARSMISSVDGTVESMAVTLPMHDAQEYLDTPSASVMHGYAPELKSARTAPAPPVETVGEAAPRSTDEPVPAAHEDEANKAGLFGGLGALASAGISMLYPGGGGHPSGAHEPGTDTPTATLPVRQEPSTEEPEAPITAPTATMAERPVQAEPRNATSKTSSFPPSRPLAGFPLAPSADKSAPAARSPTSAEKGKGKAVDEPLEAAEVPMSAPEIPSSKGDLAGMLTDTTPLPAAPESLDLPAAKQADAKEPLEPLTVPADVPAEVAETEAEAEREEQAKLDAEASQPSIKTKDFRTAVSGQQRSARGKHVDVPAANDAADQDLAAVPASDRAAGAPQDVAAPTSATEPRPTELPPKDAPLSKAKADESPVAIPKKNFSLGTPTKRDGAAEPVTEKPAMPSEDAVAQQPSMTPAQTPSKQTSMTPKTMASVETPSKHADAETSFNETANESPSKHTPMNPEVPSKDLTEVPTQDAPAEPAAAPAPAAASAEPPKEHEADQNERSLLTEATEAVGAGVGGAAAGLASGMAYLKNATLGPRADPNALESAKETEAPRVTEAAPVSREEAAPLPSATTQRTALPPYLPSYLSGTGVVSREASKAPAEMPAAAPVATETKRPEPSAAEAAPAAPEPVPVPEPVKPSPANKAKPETLLMEPHKSAPAEPETEASAAPGTKAEPPKAEPPKVEPPKAEPPKSEPPKVEPPKAQPPKVEPPKAQPPKAEPPKAQPPKVEPPKTQPPKAAAKDAESVQPRSEAAESATNAGEESKRSSRRKSKRFSLDGTRNSGLFANVPFLSRHAKRGSASSNVPEPEPEAPAPAPAPAPVPVPAPAPRPEVPQKDPSRASALHALSGVSMREATAHQNKPLPGTEMPRPAATAPMSQPVKEAASVPSATGPSMPAAAAGASAPSFVPGQIVSSGSSPMPIAMTPLSMRDAENPTASAQPAVVEGVGAQRPASHRASALQRDWEAVNEARPEPSAPQAAPPKPASHVKADLEKVAEKRPDLRETAPAEAHHGAGGHDLKHDLSVLTHTRPDLSEPTHDVPHGATHGAAPPVAEPTHPAVPPVSEPTRTAVPPAAEPMHAAPAVPTGTALGAPVTQRDAAPSVPPSSAAAPASHEPSHDVQHGLEALAMTRPDMSEIKPSELVPARQEATEQTMHNLETIATTRPDLTETDDAPAQPTSHAAPQPTAEPVPVPVSVAPPTTQSAAPAPSSQLALPRYISRETELSTAPSMGYARSLDKPASVQVTPVDQPAPPTTYAPPEPAQPKYVWSAEQSTASSHAQPTYARSLDQPSAASAPAPPTPVAVAVPTPASSAAPSYDTYPRYLQTVPEGEEQTLGEDDSRDRSGRYADAGEHPAAPVPVAVPAPVSKTSDVREEPRVLRGSAAYDPGAIARFIDAMDESDYPRAVARASSLGVPMSEIPSDRPGDKGAAAPATERAAPSDEPLRPSERFAGKGVQWNSDDWLRKKPHTAETPQTSDLDAFLKARRQFKPQFKTQPIQPPVPPKDTRTTPAAPAGGARLSRMSSTGSGHLFDKFLASDLDPIDTHLFDLDELEQQHKVKTTPVLPSEPEMDKREMSLPLPPLPSEAEDEAPTHRETYEAPARREAPVQTAPPVPESVESEPYDQFGGGRPLYEIEEERQREAEEEAPPKPVEKPAAPAQAPQAYDAPQSYDTQAYDAYGQPTYGQPSYDAYGQPTYDQQAYDQQAYDAYGQQAYDQQAYDAAAYGGYDQQAYDYAQYGGYGQGYGSYDQSAYDYAAYDQYGQPYDQYTQQAYEYPQYDQYGRPVDAYGQPVEGYDARGASYEQRKPRVDARASRPEAARAEAPRAPRAQAMQPGQTYESFAQPSYDGYAHASRKRGIPAAHQLSDPRRNADSTLGMDPPMAPAPRTQPTSSPRRAKAGPNPQPAAAPQPKPTAGSVASAPSSSGRHRRQGSGTKRGGRWAALLSNDPLSAARN